MHRTIRIFLGSFVFLGVSVLSAVEQAPFVQIEEDAEAFTGGIDVEGHGQVGDQSCMANCSRGMSADCKGPKSMQCLAGCKCSTAMEPQKSCSAREPCERKADGTTPQSCINGVCLYQCKEDKDCPTGVCRAGSCRRRSLDDVNSCKASCDVCKKKLAECKQKVTQCVASCR